MKNTMQILSHFIALVMLGVLFSLGAYTFSLDAHALVLYGICLLLCPFLGLCRLSAFVRILFYILSVFGLCGGVFIAKVLGGEFAALAVLSVSVVTLGALLTYFSLPTETKEIEHLQLRGIKTSHARRIILLRQSYAFFFQKSGVLFSVLAVYSLLLSPTSANAIWSAAALSFLVSFLGHLLYLMLSTHESKIPCAAIKKGGAVVISLLSFSLLLISVYVYVGSLYTSPDPALKAALDAVKEILTPSYIGALVAIVPGMLFGLFLSLMGSRFFKTVLSGTQILPAALFSGMLYPLLSDGVPYAVLLSVCLPLFLLGALGTLEGRVRLIPYKYYPISDRKKALLRPFFHLPNLALIPKFFATSVFSSVFLHLTTGGTLYALSSLSQTLVALILGVILCILYVLCILTREVRPLG